MGLTSSRPAKRTPWSCRLPVEIVETICEKLVSDRALGTLASLQSTSSSLHTLITPFLYRHIVFDTRHAILFLDLFNRISPVEKETFLDLQLDTDSHFLDKTLAVRLRSFISYTQSLTLYAQQEMSLHFPKDYDRLQAFHALQKSVWDEKHIRNPLWPSFRNCHIDLTAWPNHSRFYKDRWSSLVRLIPPVILQLVEILFYNLHPENMSIVVPDRLIDVSDIDSVTGEVFWWTCIKGLHADHIELAGLQSVGTLQHFPSAVKSLSIRIDRPPHRDSEFVEDRECRSLNRLKARAVHLLRHEARGPLLYIDTLRLISLIRPDEYAAADPNHSRR